MNLLSPLRCLLSKLGISDGALLNIYSGMLPSPAHVELAFLKLQTIVCIRRFLTSRPTKTLHWPHGQSGSWGDFM